MEQNGNIAAGSTLKLYSAVGSRGFRVEKLLELMDVSYELVRISIGKKENKTSSYIHQVHPLGLIPALKHGDAVLVESGAIMLYLADLFPSKNMCPAVGTPERGKYYEWFMLTLATIEPIMANIMSKGQVKSESELKLQSVLRAIDNRIGAPYLLGQHFCAADVLVHSEIHWIKKYLKGVDFSGMDHINEYYDRLMNRLNWS